MKALRRFLDILNLKEMGLSDKFWLIRVFQNLKQIYDGLETYDSSRGISTETIIGTNAIERQSCLPQEKDLWDRISFYLGHARPALQPGTQTIARGFSLVAQLNKTGAPTFFRNEILDVD